MRVCAGGELALGEQRGCALGLAPQRAQHVERDHVARALPDGADLDVAVELRHRRLLDVAVAAQALERLGRERRAALAHPVLHDRQREATEGAPRRGRSRVERARDPQRRCCRRLGLEREVGEHVDHRRLLGQRRAERARWRACQIASATTRRIIPATAISVSRRVQTSCSTTKAVPRPSSPRMRAGRWSYSTSEEARQRPPSLSFRRWMRKPGCGRSATKQVIPASVCASVKKTSNTGWVQNHLWPVSSNQPSPIGSADGRVGAQVRAALLLGEDHPGLREGVVVGQRQAPLPLARQRRVLAHRRHCRVVDRHRAARPRVELVEEVEQRRPHHVRAGARLAPRQRVDLALDAQAQHPVHRRVVLDLVDAVAVAVVGVQHRDVALRALGVRERLRARRRPRRSRARGPSPSRRLRASAPRAAPGRRRSAL